MSKTIYLTALSNEDSDSNEYYLFYLEEPFSWQHKNELDTWFLEGAFPSMKAALYHSLKWHGCLPVVRKCQREEFLEVFYENRSSDKDHRSDCP